MSIIGKGLLDDGSRYAREQERERDVRTGRQIQKLEMEVAQLTRLLVEREELRTAPPVMVIPSTASNTLKLNETGAVKVPIIENAIGDLFASAAKAALAGDVNPAARDAWELVMEKCNELRVLVRQAREAEKVRDEKREAGAGAG